MRWSTNANMKVNMEDEIEKPANRTSTPQARGGPEREVISGAIGIVSGIGGAPNQPAAILSSRGRSAMRVPAASPTSRSRPTRGSRRRPSRRRPEATSRHGQRRRTVGSSAMYHIPNIAARNDHWPTKTAKAYTPPGESEKPPSSAQPSVWARTKARAKPSTAAVPAPEPQVAGGENWAADHKGHDDR